MPKSLLTQDVILAKEIKYALESTNYPVGKKLPSERQLAEELQVSRLTLRRALSILVSEKYLIAKDRSGYYIAPKRIPFSLRDMGVRDYTDYSHVPLTPNLLQIETIPLSAELQEKIPCSPDTVLYHSLMLCTENSTPVCILEDYVPADLNPDLPEHLKAGKAVISLYRNSDVHHMAICNYKLSQIPASAEQATLLALEPGTLLTQFCGTFYDKNKALLFHCRYVGLIEKFVLLNDK